MLAFNAQQETSQQVIAADPPLMTETADVITEEFLKDIQDIQNGLERLRLKVKQRRSINPRSETSRDCHGSGRLKVGEEVIIRNPKKGQEKVGTVGKVHVSGWITVNGWKRVNGVRIETKIKRIRSNLVRKQS